MRLLSIRAAFIRSEAECLKQLIRECSTVERLYLLSKSVLQIWVAATQSHYSLCIQDGDREIWHKICQCE